MVINPPNKIPYAKPPIDPLNLIMSKYDYTLNKPTSPSPPPKYTPDPSLPYDPLALAMSTYDYTLNIPKTNAQAPGLAYASSKKKSQKLSGIGTNIWTALDALFAAGTAVTNQIANWTDGKADWKDIPLAESFTHGWQGMREAWKDGELGLKDFPTFGFAAGVSEKGKKGKDIVMNLGLKDTKGKLDWADVIGFGADVALDPLTYLTLGFGSVIKAGARGVRLATPAVMAKYGVQNYKAVGRNAEAIISNAEKAIINQRTAHYMSKGATENLATRLATKESQKAVTELGDILKATRSDAEKFIGFLDVPFTERTKGLIKRPEWLKRKAGEIGTDGAQLLVSKLVQKGMTNAEEIKAFFQKNFNKSDPATLTRAEADYFNKELDRIRIANLPNAKVTETIMKQFPQVTEDVQKAINNFQQAVGATKPAKATKAAIPTTIEEMITIAKGGQPAEQQATTYRAVADYVKSELTQIAKGDAENLTRLIQSQFKVPRESARSIINQLKNDGILVPSKQAGMVFDVNKGAEPANLATKADVDRYINESNENLYNIAQQLITKGNISDVKNDKSIIAKFVNDVNNGVQLTQKQIDTVRKRVTKYTGQTVPKVQSATSRVSAASMKDRSSVAFLINRTKSEVRPLEVARREASTALATARKNLKDQNANAVREAKSKLRQVRDEAKAKVDDINQKITSISKKIEEYKAIIDDAKAKLAKAQEVAVKQEVISPVVKPVEVESLLPYQLKEYEKLLTKKQKARYLEEKAAEKLFAQGYRVAILSDKSIDGGFKTNFTDIEKGKLADLIRQNKIAEYDALKQQLINKYIDEMKALNVPDKAVNELNKAIKTNRTYLSKANKTLTSYRVELTTLQAKLDAAKKAFKEFDPASVSLEKTSDAIKAAEEALKQADDALTSKIDELTKLEELRKAESIPEQIRQMVQPPKVEAPKKPKRTFRLLKPEFKTAPSTPTATVDLPLIKEGDQITAEQERAILQLIEDLKKPKQKATYDKVYGKRQLPDARPKVEEGLTKAQNLLKSWQAKEAQLKANPPKVQAEAPPVVASTQAPRIPYNATETKAVEEHFAKEKGNTIKIIFKPYQGRPSNKFIKTFEDFLAFQITPRAKYAQEIALLTKATGTGRKPAVVKTKAVLQKEIDQVENKIQGLINSKLIVKQDGKNVVNTAINMSQKQKEYAESLIKKINNLRKRYDKAPVTAPTPKPPVAAVDEVPKTANQKLIDDVAEKEKLLRQAREDYKKFLQGEYTVRVKARNKQGELVYTEKKITKPNITEEELIKLENQTSKALKTMAEKLKNQPIAETKPLKLTASQQKKYDALKTDVDKADYIERLQVIDNLPPFKMSEKQMAKFNSLPEELDLPKKDRQRTKYFNDLETEYVTKKLAEYYKQKGVQKARYTPSQLRELSKLSGKEREAFLAKIKDEAELMGRVKVFGELSDKIDNVIAMRQQLTEYQTIMAQLIEQGRKLNSDFLDAQNALNKAGLPEAPKATKTADPAIQKYNQDLAEARQNVLKYSDEVLKAEKALNDFDANIAYFSKLDQTIPVENLSNAIEQIVSTPITARFKPKTQRTAPTTGEMPKLDSDQMVNNIMQSLDEAVQGTKNLVRLPAGVTKTGKIKSGTVKPVRKVTRMQQVLDEVEKAPPILQREVKFIPRTDAAKIINSSFRAFQGDAVGKSKLWGFLSKNKYTNPRTLGTGNDYMDSFGKDIKKTDIKLYGKKYEMMKEVAKIDKAVKQMAQDEIDSIIYFMQKSYPGKMTANQYFTKLGIDADGIERIKDVSIRMGKIFKKIGNEQQQAQLLGMLRRNYFPHVYKLSDEQSEMLLLRYEDDPIVKQLIGRSQKDGFSNARKSFQTLAEFDDYLADMKKKITNLEAKPTLTDDEVAKLEKLQQKYEDLSDVIERNPVKALSRRYYKAIVSTTNRELINGLKQYGLIASKEAGKKAGKNMIQLDAQNAGLLGLKSGDYINRDVFNGLKKIEGMFTDTGINNFINQVDSVQNIWKQTVTTIVPKYYITNFIGNVFNNSMAGIGAKSYVEAGKAMRAYSKGTATPAQKQLIREAIDNGVLYQGWQADFRDAMDFRPKKDAGQKIKDWFVTKDEKFTKGKLGKIAGGYKRGLEKFGDVSDDFARLAHYIDVRGKTNSVEMAADSVKKYLFNYRETTQLDKFLRGSVFPFWMWVRNNVPLQIDKILREPRFALTYFKLKREMQGGDLTPDDYPAWANEAGLVRNGVMYPTNLPINDLYKTLQSPAGTMRDIGAMMNPLLKSFAEIPLNKQFYSNNRIAYPGTEVQDYGRYILQSFGGVGKLPANLFFPKPSQDTNTGAQLIKDIGDLFVPMPRELK